MKILTSITIILMIHTLVASIYGMNIELLFQHLPHAFYILTGISFCALLLFILIFKKQLVLNRHTRCLLPLCAGGLVVIDIG